MVSQGFKWKDIVSQVPGRTGESIRGRYVNYLDPSLKNTKWTKEEDDILFENQRKVGNKWAEIRKLLPGRSDNSIKNRYHNRKQYYLRKIKRAKMEKSKNDRIEALVEPMKDASADVVNLAARPATLDFDLFPDVVVGI